MADTDEKSDDREPAMLVGGAASIRCSTRSLNGTGPTVDPVCLEGALPRRAERMSA